MSAHMRVATQLSSAAQMRLGILGHSVENLEIFNDRPSSLDEDPRKRRKGRPFGELMEEMRFAVHPIRVGDERFDELDKALDPSAALKMMRKPAGPMTLPRMEGEAELERTLGDRIQSILPVPPAPPISSHLNPDYNIEDLFEDDEDKASAALRLRNVPAYQVPSLIRRRSLVTDAGAELSTSAGQRSARALAELDSAPLLSRPRQALSRPSAPAAVGPFAAAAQAMAAARAGSLGASDAAAAGVDFFTEMEIRRVTTPTYFQVLTAKRESEKDYLMRSIHTAGSPNARTRNTPDRSASQDLPAFISLPSFDTPFPSWTTPPRDSSAASVSTGDSGAATYVRAYADRTKGLSLTVKR